MRLTYLLAIALAAVPLRPLAAQSSAEQSQPSTAPAFVAFHEYLDAFNSADREALTKFKAQYGYDKTVEGVLAFREYTGGFDLIKIENQSPTAITALVHWRDGEMVDERRTLTLGSNPAPTLTIVGEKLPFKRLNQKQAVAGFVQRNEELAAAGKLSGTVLLARNGKILFARAYGEANREEHVAMTLDSQIRYGSLGKMFTAVALLQLVDEGKVDLGGTVGDYLPAYPNQEFATKVKVRHLLTHMAGAGDIDNVDPDWDGDRSRFKKLDDFIEVYGSRPPAFEPGSKVEYSNYGFILLGKIIEAVTGHDFYEEVAERVFKPAGMTHTGYAPENIDLPDRSMPYTEKEGELINIIAKYPWRGMPAGGGYSTVMDLFHFTEALRTGKLLPAELLKQATSPQNSAGWYGFGFITVGEKGTLRYGHGGDAPGSNANLVVYPESGWVTIALANRDPQVAYRSQNWFEPRMPIN